MIARPAASNAARRSSLCLTGPESSGKSHLAAQLAHAFELPLVPEQARSLLSPGVPYTVEDLRRIAAAQERAERVAEQHGRLAVFDTDILVVALWWRDRFAPTPSAPWPPWLQDALLRRRPRTYLLCAPDLPWEADPLREAPTLTARQRLFGLHERLLASNPFPWRTVSGLDAARLASARAGLRQLAWQP